MLAKRMRFLLCQPAEGDTVITLLRRRREMSLNKWKFWQGVCHLLREQMYAVLKSSLKLPWLAAFVLALWLVYCFVCASVDDAPLAVKLERPKPEISRGPPKRFIPIPKTEIGGCARSDSLIRSLIFWRAVPPVL